MLQYDVVDNYVERRAPYRDQHLKLAQEAHKRGELLLAGAFADPSGWCRPRVQNRRRLFGRAVRGS